MHQLITLRERGTKFRLPAPMTGSALPVPGMFTALFLIGAIVQVKIAQGGRQFLMNIIFNIATTSDWEIAMSVGFYQTASFKSEGFIHFPCLILGHSDSAYIKLPSGGFSCKIHGSIK